jgi:hypothetical protein
MPMPDHKPDALDFLAMIAVRCQQINAAVTATAAGARPPTAEALRQGLDGINDLVDHYEKLMIAKVRTDG